jgi:hypothetical protein
MATGGIDYWALQISPASGLSPIPPYLGLYVLSLVRLLPSAPGFLTPRNVRDISK